MASGVHKNAFCWRNFVFIISLHCKEEELRSLQTELSSLNEQLSGERIKQQQQADFIKRLQRKLLLVTKVLVILQIWAASRQNQQKDCAPSEDSDQPGRLPSLIRVFAVCSMGS